MVIMSFNEITVIALKKIYNLVQIKRIYRLEFLLSYFFCKVCMIATRHWQDQANDGKPATIAPPAWLAVLAAGVLQGPCTQTHASIPHFYWQHVPLHQVQVSAKQGCCQGGYRWEQFSRLCPSWQPENECSTGSIYFILQWHCRGVDNSFKMD